MSKLNVNIVAKKPLQLCFFIGISMGRSVKPINRALGRPSRRHSKTIGVSKLLAHLTFSPLAMLRTMGLVSDETVSTVETILGNLLLKRTSE